MRRSMVALLLICIALIFAQARATTHRNVPIPRPQAEPAVTMQTLLEKTLFKVDVLTLDLWLGPETTRRLAPWLPPAEGKAARDSVAAVALDSRDAWATIVFRRNVSLDQFLGGIDANMRKARDAGLLDPAGYRTVAEGLPRYFAPLAERGIKKDDRIFYRIRNDTLRTVFQQQDGRVVVDQIDRGSERRLSLLGSFFVKGSDFRRGLVTSLQRTSRE